TTGMPVVYGTQFPPPSMLSYTPMSVPAHRRVVLTGSIISAFTGTSGNPLPEADHVGVPVERLVVFHTCWPAGRLKPPKQAYAMDAFVGSIFNRQMECAGMPPPVMFVRTLEPVVVPQIWKLLSDTRRVLSSVGAIAIELIGTP